MGFGRIIGGALAGAGAGMTALAESRELERRAVALENLRSSNQRVEMEAQYNFADRNNARQELRELNSAKIIGEQEGRQAAAALEYKGRQEAIKADADRKHEERMVTLRGKEDRLTAQARAAIENNQVQTTAVNDAGKIVIITKGGQTIETNQVATIKDREYNPNTGGSDDGGGSVLSQVRGGQAPAPASTPKPKPTPTSAPAKPAASQDRTMTQADIDATASANGITKEMARRLLEQRGFKLKG